MESICIVTGGSGYIGGFLIRDLLDKREFSRIYNFDLRDRDFGDPRVRYVKVDLRKPIREEIGAFDPRTSWIYNLAAVCREPGFEPREYFDTNVGAAESVTAFAEEKGFRNILFTSTMSSYGRMHQPTAETAKQYPETPYGISKLVAEKLHLIWLERDAAHRLIICRPGVIFGPGDKENIPRMIKAVRKGYFLFPGSPDIVKGYGYVHGLVEGFAFVRSREGRLIVFNYAERDCLPLGGMVKAMSEAFGRKAFTVKVPIGLLVLAAFGIQALGKLTGKRYAIHPVRVRKVAFPTNLKPQYLIDAGFPFKYPLEKALEHWKRVAPEDFG